eukprot:TRINITY_DN1138_c0_g1_i1.p1 TRINITY_DN1138_c0_g1~~TRINITY_DN1138_c0_g1_i1.p1  ORF type:complete len:1110 (+),score=218.58 TRINITY_DN1138_c0_g1_i1:3958-7287(+)
MSAMLFDGSTQDGFEAIPTFKCAASIRHGARHGPLGPNGIVAFRHKKSRVRIVMFAAPGPIVSGTIIVGTRAISNAGHPHTLEHIVFLGSQKHPTRGYLDHLACRCIADGTNAWTDNDHTAYTCATAGFDGFAHLLPCFLDHVLRPKINDASFVSEVYHVRADGKEAGVVFCEMQAREHTEADIADRELRGLLLAGTPLSLECGGLCEHIRHLSNEEIVRFHQDQYCGANVTIVVGGSQIVPNELLRCIKSELDDVSSSATFHAGEPQWRMPLNLQPLPPCTRRVVPFPCADTELGTIVFGWRGTGVVDRLTNMAVEVLLHYFTRDVWSPMQQRFVETENQIASDISFSHEIFRDASVIEISFEGIKHVGRDDSDDDSDDDDEDDDDDDAEEEDEEEAQHEESDNMSVEETQSSLLTSNKVEQMFGEFLTDIVRCGKLPGGLESMHETIRDERERFLAALESECHETVANCLVEEIVYGEGANLTIGEKVRGCLHMYDTLGGQSEKFWVDLIDNVLVKAPRVQLVMVPDCALAEELSHKEKVAHESRVQRFGKQKLEALGKANEGRIAGLKAASFNSWCFPALPSTANVCRWLYSVCQTQTDFYVAQSVQLESELVRCTILVDTSHVPVCTRVFLPLVCELLLKSDVVLSDGSRISYADNARNLDKVTISTGSSGVFVGLRNGAADHCLVIEYAASADCFEHATKLILQNVFECEMSAERVAVVSQSLLANCTADMRDGSEALSCAVMLVPYLHDARAQGACAAESDSGGVYVPNWMFNNSIGNHGLFSMLCEQFVHKQRSDEAQRASVQAIQRLLTSLRQASADSVFVQVAARDTERAQATLARQWSQHVHASKTHSGGAFAQAICRRRHASLSELLGRRTVGRIVGIGGVESSSIEVRVDCGVHEAHGDWSALAVLLQMLGGTEGRLSDAVRANGLAYGASITNHSWHSQLSVEIYESSSPSAAWDAVCDALRELRRWLHDESSQCEVQAQLDSAKASTLFQLTQRRATPDAVAFGAVCRSADGMAPSAMGDRAVERSVERVCVKQLARVYDKHVARVLRDDGRLMVLTCAAAMSSELIHAFGSCRNAVALVACSLQCLQPRFAPWH